MKPEQRAQLASHLDAIGLPLPARLVRAGVDEIDEAVLDRLASAVDDYLTRMHGIFSSKSVKTDEARRMLLHAFEPTDGDWLTRDLGGDS